MINLLLIDDNKELCQSLKDKCLSGEEFTLDYALNLADGVRLFTEQKGFFDAIILDGRGHHSKKDTKERDNHVLKGIKDIRVLDAFIPIFIYTAYLDIVNEQIHGIIEEEIPIFNKKSADEEKLFNAIKETVLDGDKFKIKTKYKDLLEIFDRGLLDKDNEDIYEGFWEIITCLENDNFETLSSSHQSGILNKFRMILEHIYSSLSEFYPNVLPESLTQFGKRKNHLNGNKDPQNDFKETSEIYQDDSIARLSKIVHSNPGEYNHFIKKNTGFYTKYGIKALAFSLFEVMMWYKNGIDSGLFD